MSVKLLDYADYFRDIVPGADLSPGPNDWGIQVNWHMQVVLDAERAVDVAHAGETLHAFAEQVRAHASRELGLDPLMEGLRRENRALMEANRQLSATLRALRDDVQRLQQEATLLAERAERAEADET